MKDNAANGGPVAGNPYLNAVQDEMERLQSRGGAPDLPEDFGDFSESDVGGLIVKDFDDPAILEKEAELEEFRRRQKKKPRRIPGLLSGPDRSEVFEG